MPKATKEVAPGTAAIQFDTRPSKRKLQEWRQGYLFLLPAVVILGIFIGIAAIFVVYLSFHKVNLFTDSYTFVGLENYLRLFTDETARKALTNTLSFSVVVVPCQTIIALIIASVLNSKIRGRTTFRAIFFLPMVVAPAAVAMVWKWIFNSQYGIINTLLGLDIGWLTDSHIVLITCSIVQIWSNIGYDAVLLLAGLQNISVSLYEAADLDGASKVRQFFSITLPMVSPTLFVVLIMRLMSSLKVFDLIYMMVDDANPALNDAQSLMSLFYRESFIAGDKGYASAIVVWTVLLIGAVTLIQFIGQKKWVNYEV